MFELFVFGTLWFWLLLIASFAILTYQVNIGSGFKSFLVFALTLFLFIFMGNLEFFDSFIYYIKNNSGKALLIFLGYFLAGAIWSIVKWYYFLLNSKEEQKKRKIDYPSLAKDFKFKIPKPSEHKSDIILWMSYWPFSAFWTLIDNPFKKIFNGIFKRLEGVYNKIAAYVFKDLITTTNEE